MIRNIVHTPNPLQLKPLKELQTLVENRTVFTMNHCEMNVYETHQTSHQVSLYFNDLVFTTMLRGKKVMHLFGDQHFDYLPGESVVLPAESEMRIDFPEASLQKPTQCVALAIAHEKIHEIVEILNEQYPKIESGTVWNVDLEEYHFKNSLEIASTIDRLIKLSTQNYKEKDILADFALKELLIHLMQTQARALIIENYKKLSNQNRFAHIIEYIQNNLAENINIDKLSNLACMSKSNFFKFFKREFGISPTEYIIEERIKKAKLLLKDPQISIVDVGFRVGFNSMNHFFKLFKKYEKMTPKQYQMSIK